MVTGKEIVVVAPDGSKFSRCSPAFCAALDTVEKLGAVLSYANVPPLPAAEKYTTP